GAAGKLQALLEPFREGGCPIRVTYRNDAAEAELPLGDGWRVRLDDTLLESLRDWLPPESVEVIYHSVEGARSIDAQRLGRCSKPSMSSASASSAALISARATAAVGGP